MTRRGWWIAAAAALLAAAAVLAIGADTSPTNLQTRRLFGLWRARHALAAMGLLMAAIAFVARARSPSALRTVLASLVSAGLAFGALEGLGRAGVLPWQSIFAPSFGDLGALGTKPVPSQDVQAQSRKDTASVWGIPSEPIDFRYKTDRHGFRNVADREGADVYLIGDSVLVAALVPIERTLVARLEAHWMRPVMQAALINTAPQTMIAAFENLALDVRDRLVIQFIFEGNDLVDSAAIQPEAAAMPPVKFESDSFFDHAWRLVTTLSEPTLGVARARSCEIAGTRYTFFWARESFAGFEAQQAVITRALDDFRTRIEARGARYAVVFVPTKLRVLGPLCPRWPDGSDLADTASHLSPLRDHLLDWGKAGNVPVLDLTPALQAAARAGTIPWFDADTHWSERGHDIAAREIARWAPFPAR